MPIRRHFTYRRANLVLLCLILLVDGYVIAAPFLPQLLFQLHKGQEQALTQAISQPKATPPAGPPQPNHIIIPSMALDTPVYEGRDTYAELNKGVWRWPGGSTPDKGGNTVMLAHRFTYTNPRGTFYFLNKVAVNDKLGVVWDNKTYRYKVTNIQVVQPTAVEILNPTADPTLTLYTCTPTWNPKQRLVVTAKLEN